MLDGAIHAAMTLSVSAGTQASRRIQLPAGGSVVLNFALDEHDISASVATESIEGSHEHRVVVEAVEKALSGRFVHTAARACTLVVVFDNSYSMIRGKKVSIKLSGFPPGVPVPADDDADQGTGAGAGAGAGLGGAPGSLGTLL
jgi:hypothetical protein